MNATELYLKNGKSAGVFYCEKCHYVAPSQVLAEQCCKNYLCSKCGKDTGSRSWLDCDSCRKASKMKKECERFEKAEKLTEWNGWVYLEGTGNDGFSENLEVFYDDWESNHEDDIELPKYVWACKPNYFVHADTSDITDQMLDEYYENWDPETLDGLDELKLALEKFNKANSSVASYEPDYSKAILLNIK